MSKLSTALGLAAGALLSTQASALVTDYSITGQLDGQDNTCVGAILALFTQEDCSYNDKAGSLDGLTWIGPLYGGGFYIPGTEPGHYTGGNNNPNERGTGLENSTLNPAISGTISVDDNNTVLLGNDDTIAGTIVIGPATRHFNSGPVGWGNETWDAWTLSFAATGVDSAVQNADLGFDYVIGSQGFLPLIVGSDGDIFPSENGAKSGQPLYWTSGPGATTPSIVDDPVNATIGTTATSTFTNYSCDDLGGLSGDCSLGTYGAFGDVDNLLLKISTDVLGNITSGELIYNFNADTFGAADDDAWFASYGTFSTVPLPAGVWLFGSALALLGWVRRRHA